MQGMEHITTSVILLQIQLTFLLALSLVGHFPHPHYKLSGVSLSFSLLYHSLLEKTDDVVAVLVVVVVVVVVVAAAVAVVCVSSYSVVYLSTEIALSEQYIIYLIIKHTLQSNEITILSGPICHHTARDH
jgi:uncharacterized paraquat-inducible protein A